MSKVLGLSFFFHDSAAALICDGDVVAAAAEERFCRRKHTNEFPKLAIEYCLEAGKLRSVNDLDAIVFYEKPILKFHRVVETLVAVWPRGLVTFVRKLPSFLATKVNIQRTIEKALPGYQGQILFVNHHLSHAASAFYCSPFQHAAILTIDGVGEWETTTIGVGKGREIELDRAIHFPHSIGLLYSALTSYLGFRVNDGEWKVMGLAPYGQPKYLDQFRKLVQMKPDGSFRLNMDYFVHHFSSKWTVHGRRWENLFGFPQRKPNEEIQQCHEDLARSGQMVVEEMILNLAREARRSSGCENLVIAGGVGLNCVANWKIEKEAIFDNVWIQPAAGDDGGALGAGLWVSQQLCRDGHRPRKMDPFLGPCFPDEAIRSFLDTKRIPYQRYDDSQLVDRVAELIADGQVVGWFQGRMEFGPRALGARSILGDPRNPEMKSIINRKIKYREYFRPFAPAVLLERVHEYFEVKPGAEMPFMLKVPLVVPDRQKCLPAVTHEDGTGRVQTVAEADNPLFYGLLQAFGRRTGVPVVLNTSFNVRGEPIVCSPEDAYNCFIKTGIDAVALGNYLVTTKPEVEVDFKKGFEHSDALEAQIGVDEPQPTALRSTILEPSISGETEIQQQVLSFYKELPFNYFSNSVDTASELLRANRVKAYSVLHKRLRVLEAPRVLDVGCGAGWFSNSCAHFYQASVVGMDLNPVVLQQARSVARLMPGCREVQFIEADLFEFQPQGQFHVVNTLGVLHHTPDCHAAIRRVLKWVLPGGHLHLGLYHQHGRKPFLDHFSKLRSQGWDEAELLAEFKSLNPSITDATHLLSWFRDQVLHPHETQHTFEEIHQLLQDEGFTVEATSINKFRPINSVDKIVKLERTFDQAAKKALRKKRYYPGFFVVWARKRSPAQKS